MCMFLSKFFDGAKKKNDFKYIGNIFETIFFSFDTTSLASSKESKIA